MVKKLIKGSIPMIVFFLLFYIGINEFHGIFSDNNKYNKHIKMNLPKDSIILIENDSHGGFHGDGEYYSEVQFTEDGIKEFIKSANETRQWCSYPLPNEIENLLSFAESGGETKKIPMDIKNGIYYFNDRSTGSSSNTGGVKNSYNFTIAILDSNTKKLYIYELDT